MRLDRRHDASSPWIQVCWSPCDTRTWAHDTYRVVGEGIEPSKAFDLPAAQNGKVHLRVKPASQAKRLGGMGLLGGGGVLALAGIIGIAAGHSPSQTFSTDALTHNANYDVMTVGTLLIVAGVAAGITGGAWIYDTSASTVAPASSAAPPPPTTQGALPPAPAGVGLHLPLLGGRF
jgi:hypothetical protein